MLAIFLALAAVGSSIEQDKYPVWFLSVIDFIQGALDGAEGYTDDPGRCYQNFMIEKELIFGLIDDVTGLLKGDFSKIDSYVTDYNDLDGMIDNLGTDCHYKPLVKILTHYSPELLAKNYLENFLPCTNALANLTQCGKDSQLCGHAFGTLFRLLVGWDLN